MPHVYVHTCTISFKVFGSMFVLNLILPSFRRCFLQEQLFFSNVVSVCCHEISFFLLKFYKPELAKTLFFSNFSQIITQVIRCTLGYTELV